MLDKKESNGTNCNNLYWIFVNKWQKNSWKLKYFRLLASIFRVPSLGSLGVKPSLRAGPLLAPRSDSPSPPAGPPPPLINSTAPAPSTPSFPTPPTLPSSFATSRGPSPLTLAGVDVVPLAVAFQVSQHFFVYKFGKFCTHTHTHLYMF